MYLHLSNLAQTSRSMSHEIESCPVSNRFSGNIIVLTIIVMLFFYRKYAEYNDNSGSIIIICLVLLLIIIYLYLHGDRNDHDHHHDDDHDDIDNLTSN